MHLRRHHTKILIHFHKPRFGFALHTFVRLAIDLRNGTCFAATASLRSNPTWLALASNKVKLQIRSSIDRQPCIAAVADHYLGCFDYWDSYCSFELKLLLIKYLNYKIQNNKM